MQLFAGCMLKPHTIIEKNILIPHSTSGTVYIKMIIRAFRYKIVYFTSGTVYIKMIIRAFRYKSVYFSAMTRKN